MSAFRSCLLLLALSSLLSPPPASAQSVSPSAAATLSGIVTDPTGALIPNATVTLDRAGQPPQTITADSAARYSFSALSPGTYSLTALSPGFASRTLKDIVLTDRQRRSLNLALPLETQQQQVEVGPDGSTLDPTHNGDATVLSGSALNTLSNNSSLMLQQLQGMGGSAGDSGGQIYVDGFSGGKMPPKVPSAKSVSTRTPTPPSTTPSATIASRSSPSPVAMRSTVTPSSSAATPPSTPAIPTRPSANPSTPPSSRPISAAPSPKNLLQLRLLRVPLREQRHRQRRRS